MPGSNNFRGGNGNNMSFSDSPSIGNGITGHMESGLARQEFSSRFWDDSNGYLKQIGKELDTMIDKYQDLLKYSNDMTKANKRTAEERKMQLERELKYVKLIQEQKDISSEAAQEIIKSSTDLVLDTQKKLITNYTKLKAVNKDMKVDLDNMSEYYANLKTEFTNMNKEVSDTLNTAGKSVDKLSTSISNSLKNAGDRLANLSNMFSLSKIANNTAEQNARSIEKIQSDVMKQFNFTSNSQFYRFADSLNGTLKDMNKNMGNLFNNNDLKTYMSNLGAFGITDTKMAEQQMKSSVLATKYLGVSTETQTMMFKYMKRTNNNDTIEKHNQTIVGLLKSDLGISKEQLDALSQIAYGSAEDKSAIGMTNAAITAQQSASLIAGSALTNMYGEETAKAIMNSMDEFLLNPGDDKWTAVFGGQYQDIYNSLYNGQTQQDQMNAIYKYVQGIANSNAVGVSNMSGGGLGNAKANQQLNKITGLNSLVISALKDIDMNEYKKLLENAANSVNSTTNGDVDTFVKQSTEATWLEKIENWLSTIFGVTGWKLYPKLANAAFIAYLASDAVNVFKGLSSFIGGWKMGGGLKAGLQALMGGASGSSTAMATGMSSLLKGGLVVGLTAAAIAGIAKASRDLGDKGKTEEGTRDLVMTDAERNEAGWGATAWHDVKNGGLSGIGNTLQYMGGLVTDNKEWKTQAQYKNNMAVISMMKNEQDAVYRRLAMLMLFDKADTLKWTGVSEGHDDIVKKYNSLTEAQKQQVCNYAVKIQNGSFDYQIRDKNWRVVDVRSIDWNNYHKHGLARVPKDNYKALLHKGEMVLNEQQADAYRDMMGMGPYGIGGQAATLRKNGQRGRIVEGLPWRMTAGYPTYSGGAEHTGVDFGIGVGTPVGAAYPGVVDSFTYAGQSSYGNSIYIKGDNDVFYRYAHLSKIGVKVGDRVNAGQTIGLSGNTGNSTGPHLHFEVDKPRGWQNDIDPYGYISAGLFQANGNISVSSNSVPTSSGSTSSTTLGNIPVQTTKFVPKAFRNATEGTGGLTPENTSKAINGGIDRLINYLDGIRQEQSDQRHILEAFSQSRVPASSY